MDTAQTCRQRRARGAGRNQGPGQEHRGNNYAMGPGIMPGGEGCAPVTGVGCPALRRRATSRPSCSRTPSNV